MLGKKFGRLTVVDGAVDKGTKHHKVPCLCECGTLKYIAKVHLTNGHTKSCGCLRSELMVQKQTIHGHYFEPEFAAWKAMNTRCGSHPKYLNVSVCEAWKDSYYAFLEHIGRRPSPEMSVDRIDNLGNYEPGNVRWATQTTQVRNTRNHHTSTSGVRGVSWSKTKNKWRASIYVANVQHFLGYYETLESAAEARREGQDRLWGPNVSGSSKHLS